MKTINREKQLTLRRILNKEKQKQSLNYKEPIQVEKNGFKSFIYNIQNIFK